MRVINFLVFAAMIPLGIAPTQWWLVAALELAGSLGTASALASKNNFTYNPFHVLRIASVILALVGAILTLQPFGVYGSACAFLLISSVGMIYAYHKFNPIQIREQ